MPGFNTLEDKIKKRLAKYHDEDMLWIYDIILKTNSGVRNQIKWYDLKRLKNFNQLKDLIIKELLKSESEDKVEFGFQAIENAKTTFIRNEIFNEFKKDSRLCLFTLSFLDKHSLDKKESQIDLDYLFKDKSTKISTETLLTTNKEFKFISKNYVYINFIFKIFYNRVSERELIKIKQKYENKIKKEINSSSKFNDQNFINWSYDYLMSRKSDFERASKSCFDDNDKKLLIISYLDFLNLSNPQGHENLTTKMSKAWSQKKFRDADKVKKNYHIPLTQKAKEELSELSAFKNTSEAKILEELIHQMFLDQMCDENGKSKY